MGLQARPPIIVIKELIPRFISWGSSKICRLEGCGTNLFNLGKKLTALPQTK
jgi:hypothetical protein